MLRFALMAVAVAAIVAAGIVLLLPTASGPRPEPRILAGGDQAPPVASGGFVIHDAPAPAAAPSPPPAPPPDLDAVMSRLRAASAQPDAAPATPPAAAPLPAAALPPAAPPPNASPPTVPSAPLPTVVTPPDPTAASPRWTSVTGQGTRWRMTRGPGGYLLSIDLGGGQTADIHVQPAFTALDPAAVNVRVDYLRDTILQNFSSRSDSYTFARDGSVSLDR